MNRLTITNEILDEINFEVPSDKEGSYNILDIAKYSDEEEMQKILLNIVDRLADYEDLEEQGLLIKLPMQLGELVLELQDNILKKRGIFIDYGSLNAVLETLQETEDN